MSNPQKAHYEAIHDAYRSHYFDPTALRYRKEFLFKPLLEGVDLNGRRVADIASGSGENSAILRRLFPLVEMEGFDISRKACADYRKLVGRPANEIDLTMPQPPDPRFDAAIVIGGLHHCVADLETAVSNVVGMLKPGGRLLAIEPNADFFLQAVRDRWYRADRYFDAATERALKPSEIAAAAGGRMIVEREFYFGGPAYFVILNSLVMRVPLSAKKATAGFFLMLERAWRKLPGRSLHAAFGLVLVRADQS